MGVLMNRENWLKNIEGAVFDLDGTLLDSSWVWEKVDEKFLGDRGFQVPDDYVDEISPLGAERAAVYTIERFGLNEDKDDIVREWIEMAKKEYATEVVCKPYAKEFLEELHKLNIKMAVATSSDRELFMKTLEREGILEYFQKIVTVDEVERGKGYPDIYEEAARRIKVNPHKCLVFEDIIPGIQAGKAANMKVCAVHDLYSLHQTREKQELADFYIYDYEDVMKLLDQTSAGN